MLEIHQKNDISGYEKYIGNIENPIIIEAFGENRVIGFCIYYFDTGKIVISSVSYGNDIYLCDGLVRTALFKASLIGIDRAEFLSDNIELLSKLKLCDKNGILSSIMSVMDGCASCKGKNN